MQKEQFNTKKAFSIVEVILSLALFSIIVSGLAGSLYYALESNIGATYQTRASFIANEGLEAAKSIRKDAFTNLVDGKHGVSITSGKWVFSSTSDVVDGFTRVVEVFPIDTFTKKVVSTVTWTTAHNPVNSITYTEHLTDWTRNTPLNIWASVKVDSTIDLPGNNDSLRIISDGTNLYTSRAAGNNDLSVVRISDSTQIGVADPANVVGDIYKVGNTIYLASTNNSEEFIIYDVSTITTPTQIGTLNTTGNNDGIRVVVSGTNAFLLRGNLIQTINVSTPNNPVTSSAAITTNTPTDMDISGNYLYISTTNGASEIQIVNVSNPTTPVLTNFNVAAGTLQATSVKAMGTRLYVGFNNGLFQIYDITTPLSPVLLGSFTVASSINDFDISSDGTTAFIARSGFLTNFYTLDIAIPGAVTQLANITVANGITALDYDDALVKVFAASADNSAEILIIGTN